MKPFVTDKDSLLRIEDQLCFALYSTSRAFTKEYAVLLDKMGITYPQYLVMLVLWQRDGIFVQEIASSMEIDQATATPIIQRLEKLEIVVRQRDVEDERRVQVFLTDKGKDLYNLALTVPQGIGCATGVDQTKAQKLVAELKIIKNFIYDRQHA